MGTGRKPLEFPENPAVFAVQKKKNGMERRTGRLQPRRPAAVQNRRAAWRAQRFFPIALDRTGRGMVR